MICKCWQCNTARFEAQKRYYKMFCDNIEVDNIKVLCSIIHCIAVCCYQPSFSGVWASSRRFEYRAGFSSSLLHSILYTQLFTLESKSTQYYSNCLHCIGEAYSENYSYSIHSKAHVYTVAIAGLLGEFSAAWDPSIGRWILQTAVRNRG